MPATGLLTMAALDPLRAVEAIEAMPEPTALEPRDANWLRIMLAYHLGPARLWESIWDQFSGIGHYLNRRDLVH